MSETAFPMAVRALALWNSRWVRRATWTIAVVAALVVLRLTLFRPAPVPVTVFRAARAASRRASPTARRAPSGPAAEPSSRRRSEDGCRSSRCGRGPACREGEVLMRIADGDYRAQVDLQQQRRRGRASRRGSRRAGRGGAARPGARAQRALSREKLVSVDVLDQLQRPPRRRRGGLRGGRAPGSGRRGAALEAARVNLEKTVLRAPFDGVVAERHDRSGGVDHAVAARACRSRRSSCCSTTECDLRERPDGRGRRRQGARRPGRPDHARRLPGPIAFAGQVTRVAPYVQDVQEQNRIFEIEAELDDAAFARELRPGPPPTSR